MDPLRLAQAQVSEWFLMPHELFCKLFIHGVNWGSRKKNLCFFLSLKHDQIPINKGAKRLFHHFSSLSHDSNGPVNHNLRHKSNTRALLALLAFFLVNLCQIIRKKIVFWAPVNESPLRKLYICIHIVYYIRQKNHF